MFLEDIIMSDLNLNFDTGAKSISVLGGESSGSLNLGFKPDSSTNATSPVKTVDISSPKLSVSDPNGMGMLIGKPGLDVICPKSDTPAKADTGICKRGL